MNLIGHLQVLPNHILANHLFTIPWNKDGVQVTRFGKETSFFDYCTSTRHTLWYPRVSFFTIWNLDVVQVTIFTENTKSRFSTLIWPLGKIPKPYCTSTGHGQSSPRISLVFFLKCWRSLNDKTTLENVNFRPLFDPRGQNENFETLLRIYKTRPMRS